MKQDKRFPHDIKIGVMVNFDVKKQRSEWQSKHLMTVHKWSEADVRVMQANRGTKLNTWDEWTKE